MTEIAVQDTRFTLDGQLTYPGRAGVEGLLFNVRTVNATFDDTLGRVDWWDDDGTQPGNGSAGYGPWTSPASAEANTARYIAGLAEYRAHGVLAVSLCMQGGHPLKAGRTSSSSSGTGSGM